MIQVRPYGPHLVRSVDVDNVPLLQRACDSAGGVVAVDVESVRNSRTVEAYALTHERNHLSLKITQTCVSHLIR